MQVFYGWKMGLEPTTFGTTIRRSNQLSYVHHVRHFLSNAGAKIMPFLILCKNNVKNLDFLSDLPFLNDGWGNAVAALDKLAHREDATQVDVIVKKQYVGIFATLQ